MIGFTFLFSFMCVILEVVSNVPKSKVLKCAVCRELVFELHSTIVKEDPRKIIEVGSFRIGADGEQIKNTKRYAGSQTHMSEVLESVCGNFKDYAMGRHKATNELEVIKLVIDGKMNPDFSSYELVQDPDLNKGVEYHCESMVEDFEDEILKYFAEASVKENFNVVAAKIDFCESVIDICLDVKEEL